MGQLSQVTMFYGPSAYCVSLQILILLFIVLWSGLSYVIRNSLEFYFLWLFWKFKMATRVGYEDHWLFDEHNLRNAGISNFNVDILSSMAADIYSVYYDVNFSH